MKLAVFSDIHGNMPALTAVLEDIRHFNPDVVVMNGDLVSRGPCSLDCLRLLQNDWPDMKLLTGNHETYVLRCVDEPANPDSPTLDIDRFAEWAMRQLGGAVEEIRHWSDHWDQTDLAGGASFHITHGSRLGNRDGISDRTPEEALHAKLGEHRDLFVGSHTHRPLVKWFDERLVVNTGSVGQPMDGDPRASYGRFWLDGSDWKVEIRRVDYDKAQAERDFVDSGFLAEAGPMAKLIYRELRESRPHVGPWRNRYLEAIKTRAMTVTDAVDHYLSEID